MTLPGPPAEPAPFQSVLVAGATRERDALVLVLEQGGQFWLPATHVGLDETAEMAAARVLLSLTGVAARTGPGTSGWGELVLASLHDNPANDDRCVYAMYGILLSCEVTPSGGTWRTLSEVAAVSPEAAQAATEVLRRL